MPRPKSARHPFEDGTFRKAQSRGALNLGPKSTQWLARIHVHTLKDVRQVGVLEICRRLRDAGHPVSVVMAYALEGALRGVHWQDIPEEVKLAYKHGFALIKKGRYPGSISSKDR